MSKPARNREARAPRQERIDNERELARLCLASSLPGRLTRTKEPDPPPPVPPMKVKKEYSKQKRSYKKKKRKSR